jgi:hypothetical protein
MGHTGHTLFFWGRVLVRNEGLRPAVLGTPLEGPFLVAGNALQNFETYYRLRIFEAVFRVPELRPKLGTKSVARSVLKHVLFISQRVLQHRRTHSHHEVHLVVCFLTIRKTRQGEAAPT